MRDDDELNDPLCACRQEGFLLQQFTSSTHNDYIRRKFSALVSRDPFFNDIVVDEEQ